MAVNGDLEDINLFYIVQMLCMEGRDAALLLKRAGEKGMIFFEKGEIVHSVTSSNLVGEESLSYLMSWDKGSFHLKMDTPVTNRSISSSWKKLLMNAVQQIDEDKENLGPKIQQPLSPEDVKKDYEIEQELISLLSQLEYTQSQLSSKEMKKHPERAQQLLVGMVNDVINHAGKFIDLDVEENSLSNALKTASEKYDAIQYLQNSENILSIEAIEGCLVLNELRNGRTNKKQFHHEILLGIIQVIEVYFSHIINCFCSGLVADQWRETGDIFARDLELLVESLK
ncbi:MAG: DUF4388 domain-containing protein [Desulfobulbaceae bacterium]|nr:DUF4388 domain-containing protein [Desulfobulbaceae bacterium]